MARNFVNLGKQSRRRWFETPSRSLWRHCNDWDSTARLFWMFSPIDSKAALVLDWWRQDDKQLPEPILIEILNAIWRHQDRMWWNEWIFRKSRPVFMSIPNFSSDRHGCHGHIFYSDGFSCNYCGFTRVNKCLWELHFWQSRSPHRCERGSERLQHYILSMHSSITRECNMPVYYSLYTCIPVYSLIKTTQRKYNLSQH